MWGWGINRLIVSMLQVVISSLLYIVLMLTGRSDCSFDGVVKL